MAVKRSQLGLINFPASYPGVSDSWVAAGELSLRKRGEQMYVKTIDKFINRILLGDCVTVMEQMPEASVDFIATDPPYLVGYADRSGRRVENDDRDDWLIPAFAQMYRVLILQRR
jgi:hypothetical protein